MTAKIPKISFPVPSNKNGHPFSSAEELLSTLGGESSGLYLVGSQGMWHGGIHITDATMPWCALSTDSAAESEYCPELYKGEQFIRCMADGEIVAWRVCKSYESAGIDWRGEKLLLSNSFVLVKHYIQPGDTEESGLTFFTLYMNLAPYDAYKQQGNPLDRKSGGVLRYYSSTDDIQAERVAGKLNKNTAVTLSGNIVTRSKDQRQFTEVTITRETKNAAGDVLAAGTKVWTVSDQGNLKTAESASVPSWWAKCSPDYTAQPEGVVSCTSRTDWAYYLSREDVLQNKNAGKLAADFPLSYEPGNTEQQVTRPGSNPGDAAKTFSLVTLGRDKDKLKKGDRVWVVSDGDSLTPVAPAASCGEPVFDTVCVPPVAVPVRAGDSLGHMGFYQLPEENGKRSRYQVHIECLSMDDMEKFITNPGRVGEDTTVYLTWQADAPLFEKGEQGMVAGSRKTKTSGIVTLAKVPGADAEGNALTNSQDAAYFQIRQEGGWLPAASVQKVSQYALGELGFVTLDKAPASFDLIDGIKQPNNVVKGILEQLYKAAQEEIRTTHALNKYNYKRLLELIDRNEDGFYSEQEYLQAIHNVSYRDHLYRVIAKHASEWYYGKDDPLWKTYLDTLTTDAPTWKTYLETFRDMMTWMKAVSEKGVVLGPEVWHMHPIVFLKAIGTNGGVTYNQLKTIFPQASDANLNIVVAELQGRLEEFKLDTPTRLRHFFSQIKGEVGPQMKGKTEGFQFSPATLRSFSRYYREHPVESENDGYEKNSAGRIIRRADEQAIGRKHYLRLNGNRQSNPDDGYNFRGRGLIQVTGYEKYNGFMGGYHEYWSDEAPDTVSEPEKINTMPYAIRSALWFWLHYEVYSLDEGNGYSDVVAVTKRVNGGNMGLAERQEAYLLCEQVF
ncbi:glycoside hydrolase family 19 protein [Enterobacter kobei]|uniref:glycoside hydrolase family 19 protein n=1 Tax=Enterobacter kobei TaxID=208224 RepID=UPI000642B516|nr:chitinase [Enterobacter kobei]KLR34504.1 chitinase [Enterobacter kobei]